MRLILNENVSGTVASSLRQRGHDVLAVKESMRGASDQEVLARAQVESRLIITHDKDFGELAFRSLPPAQSGIIVFRLSGTSPEADNRRMMEIIESREDWAGHFSVATHDRVRTRTLPRPS